MPIDATFLILFVIGTILLAVIGLATVIRWIVRITGRKPASPSDLTIARRVLDELRTKALVSDESFAEVSDAILNQQAIVPSFGPPVLQRAPSLANAPLRQADVAQSSGAASGPEIVSAEIVERPKHEYSVKPPLYGRPKEYAPEVEPPPQTRVEAIVPSQRTSPLDSPALPAAQAEPRRSLGQVFAVFMQEKNIRWGELASGILIVGSAIGLVLSLRSQLSRMIPYFPALLFLLITAGVIAAGVYTLRRWRLQMTSRGILVIGLLLIPLNVLIGCWLAESDRVSVPVLGPVYWAAIVIELTSLGFLSWLAAKNLLRVRFQMLVVGILASAAYSLLINRIANPSDSVLRTAAWMSPLAAFFLLGISGIAPRMNERLWSDREIRRLLLNLGIAFFALAIGLTLFFVKWSGATMAVGVQPVMGIVGGAIAWLGHLVFSKARSRSPLWSTLSLSLIVLGTLFMLGAMVAAQVHPTLGVFTSLLVSAAFVILATRLHTQWLTIPALFGTSLAAMTATNLVAKLNAGNFHIDQWTTWPTFGQDLLTARTGISLIAAAAGLGVVTRLVAPMRRDGDARFVAARFASLFGIGAFGLGLLVLASVLYPDRPFDVSAATAALAAIGLTVLATTVRLPMEHRFARWLPALAASISGAAIVHAFWLNKAIFLRLSDAVGQPTLIALAGGVYAGLMAFSVALIYQFGGRTSVRVDLPDIAKFYSGCGIFGSLVAWASIAPVIDRRPEIATVIGVVLIAVWLIAALAVRTPSIASGFVLSSALATVIFVSSFGRRFGWFSQWTVVEFPMAIMLGLGLWSLPWAWFAKFTRNSRLEVLFRAGPLKPVQSVVSLLVLASVTMIGLGLLPAICAEIASDWSVSELKWIGLAQHWLQFGVLLSVLGLAVLMRSLHEVDAGTLELLAAIWFAGWSLGAIAFEPSVSVASAVRWLMAFAGFGLSLLFAARRSISVFWSKVAKLGGSDLHLEPNSRQSLRVVGLCLAVPVAVVMCITSIVTTAAMAFAGRGLVGPVVGSWFGALPKDVSYGLPIGILVATCLSYAISQRRSWMATVGSGVFQFCVVGSLILLCISTSPAIASVRFIQILQIVSIGMTVYGAVWYCLRHRIELEDRAQKPAKRLQSHVLINIGMMFALSCIVFAKLYQDQRIIGDWARAIGGPAGVVAIALLIPLSSFVFPLTRSRLRPWLLGIFGMVIVAIVAIHIDGISQLSLQSVGWGLALVLGIQAALLRQRRDHLGQAHFAQRLWQVPSRLAQDSPLVLVGCLSVLFSARALPATYWMCISALYFVLVICLFFACRQQSGLAVVVACGLAALNSMLAWWAWRMLHPGSGWKLIHTNYVILLSLVAIALVLVAFMIIRSTRCARMLPRSFTCWPNGIGLIVGVLTAADLIQSLVRHAGHRLPQDSVVDSLRIGLLASLVALIGFQLWNVRSRGVVFAGVIISFSWVAVGVLRFGRPEDAERWLLAFATLLPLWGVIRWYRNEIVGQLKSLRIARPARLKINVERRIPPLVVVGAAIVFIWATALVWFGPSSAVRLFGALAMIPVTLALFLIAGKPSDPSRQMAALIAAVLSFILGSWVEVAQRQSWWEDSLLRATRAFTILAFAMFVFGQIVPRWSRHGDRWLTTFRRMTLLTASAAIVVLACVVIASLVGPFAEVRLAMPQADALGVLIASATMCACLIALAIRPRHDAFANSMILRQSFVYAAQVLAVLGICFASLYVPWFFAIGLREYWPYVLMVAALAGILIAKVLERRHLEVMTRPLVNTAMLIPLAGAAGTLFAPTETDASLTMLMAGAVYLALSYAQRSMGAGLLALGFGNAALFCFYGGQKQFRFVEHPQLWMIPPALSALIAAQINRSRFDRVQLAMIRYAALGVIYASSTAEIYIQGIGDRLWPPIVLAVFALVGMLAGVLIRVRSFLFVGAVFLLLAMLTMIRHAQARLDHNWPWWAFGICTGAAILVLLGLFEKRRNDFRRVAATLKQWDF